MNFQHFNLMILLAGGRKQSEGPFDLQSPPSTPSSVSTRVAMVLRYVAQVRHPRHRSIQNLEMFGKP
jgi:hypothetical protein